MSAKPLAALSMENPGEIWNLLHDGAITAVREHEPSNLTLRIEIEYLVRMLNPRCTAIELTLVDWSAFEYTSSSGDQHTNETTILAEIEPEILSATDTGSGVRVICAGGRFDVQYADIRLAKSDGSAITLQELRRAAREYWG